MANRFEIISTRLFDTFMCCNGSIPCGTSQIFSIFVRDMLTFTILVALGESEVDNEDVITGSICTSNEEIVWLDVSMNDSFFMSFLDTSDQLHGNNEDSLQVKVALAALEKIFERWSKQVHNHDMELLIGH